MRFQKNKSLIRLQASFSVVLGNKELVQMSVPAVKIRTDYPKMKLMLQDNDF